MSRDQEGVVRKVDKHGNDDVVLIDFMDGSEFVPVTQARGLWARMTETFLEADLENQFAQAGCRRLDVLVIAHLRQLAGRAPVGVPSTHENSYSPRRARMLI